MADDRKPDPGHERHREPRLRDFARRLMREVEDSGSGGEDRGRMDAREMLGAMLETGDKAKTEVVRMVAREVRNYLEELRAGEAIQDLITNYSVEIHASVHLRPLAESEKEPKVAPEPPRATLKRKRGAKQEPEARNDEGDAQESE